MSGLTWLIDNYPDGFDDEGWCMRGLSSNESLPIELIKKYPNGIGDNWCMVSLSANPSINSNFVREHIDGINPDKPNEFCYKWILDELAQNPSIDFDFIDNYKNGFCDQQWNIVYLCKNPNITEDFILNNINEIIQNKECVNNLSANPSINEELVKKYDNFEITIDKFRYIWEWNYVDLASNPSITPDFLLSRRNLIKTTGGLKRFIYNLSKNINLSPNFLKNNPCPLGNNFYTWDMYELSKNPAISLNFIMENPNGFGVGDWDLGGLYENPNTYINVDKIDKIVHENLRNKMEHKNLKKLYTMLCSCEYILNNPQGYNCDGVITPWSTKKLSEKVWTNSNVNVNRPNKKYFHHI